MIIKQLEVNNWMTHPQKTINFKEGKNLIYGRNAAGKSSVAKAIAYNLTGIIPKNSDPRGDINEKTVVDLTLTTTEGKDFLIRRIIDSGKRINQSLFIYDAEDLAQALYTSREAEAFLENLIGLSKEIFERVIYMKEEDVHEFLANPSDAVITEIDRLIGLKKATTIREKLENLQSDIKSEAYNWSRERKRIEKGLEVKMGVDKDFNKKKAEKELENIKIRTGKAVKLIQLREEENTLEEKLDKLRKLAKTTETEKIEVELINQLVTLDEKEKSIKEKVNEIKEKLTTKKEKLSINKARKKLKIDILDIMITITEEGTPSECPTCGREMDEKLAENIKKKLENEIKNIEKNLININEAIDVLQNKIEKKDSEISEIKEKRKKLEDAKKLASTILQKYQKIKAEIAEYKKEGFPVKSKELEKMLDELDKQESEINQNIGKAEGAEKTSKEHVKHIKKLENYAKHKKKICSILEEAIDRTTETLRQDFTDKVKNTAEDIWSNYKEQKWEISWNEDFVPLAKPQTKDRDLQAYELSGSERFLILLAIRLAIQKTLESFKLLIIDEPCQHLDTENGRIFRDILTSIQKDEIQQSIILTYNSDFLDSDWSQVIKIS
ncbi:MAG: AAA family ATPase [Asgard group archaeon]|nr:AAA family ATPase [Asgard group archaeon]